MRKKDSVAIVNETFLEPTEKWILRHAIGMQHYRPIVIAKRRTGTKERRLPKIITLRSFSFLSLPLNIIGRAFFRFPYLGYEIFFKFILTLYRVRIVHIHFLWNGIWFFEYLRKPKVPVVVTAHGSDVNTALANSQYRKKIQSVFAKADKIICVSEYIKEKLLSLGCDEGKLFVNPVGIPLEKVRKKETGAKEKVSLICVAALREEKGHEYLLQAMAQVVKKEKRVQLLLVGDGYLKDRIKRLVDDLELNNFVQLLGWKKEQDVFELLSKSDIYVQHSVRHTVQGKVWKEEGLPVSLVEAAGTGLPIVATDVGGIHEVCIHGTNGLLSRPKDISGMASQILSLVENQGRRDVLGKAGRELAVRKFDEKELLGKLEDLYHRMQ